MTAEQQQPECPHARLRIEGMDQTLGLVCEDCGECMAYCWMDDHIPESLWNRACTNYPGGNPCEQSRDNVCALCEEPIKEAT
jgi:hypothetical protein